METMTTRRELALWAALFAVFAQGAQPAAAAPARTDAPLTFGAVGALTGVGEPGHVLPMSVEVAFVPDGGYRIVTYVFRDGANRHNDIMDFYRVDLESTDHVAGTARDFAEALIAQMERRAQAVVED